eukprot:2546716-Pleurochrysis_carterae.AAC.2
MEPQLPSKAGSRARDGYSGAVIDRVGREDIEKVKSGAAMEQRAHLARRLIDRLVRERACARGAVRSNRTRSARRVARRTQKEVPGCKGGKPVRPPRNGGPSPQLLHATRFPRRL